MAMLSPENHDSPVVSGKLLSRLKSVIDSCDRHLPTGSCIPFAEAEQVADLGRPSMGINRRCVGLVPLPICRADHRLAWSHNLEQTAFFRSLECSRFTGGLRVCSEERKFRGALLFLDGAVLGAIYSQQKFGIVLFDKLACNRIIAEMRSPNCLVDLYKLPREIVLSAGSLFHGGAQPACGSKGPSAVLEAVLDLNKRHGQTTTIVLNDSSGDAVAAIYVHSGQIAGIFSFQSGWIRASREIALNLAHDLGEGDVMVSTLPYENNLSVEALCFLPRHCPSVTPLEVQA